MNAESGNLMYIPRGYAHGFIANEDHTELEYLTDNVYSKEHAKSIRYDDPDIGIDWTQNGQVAVLETVLSEKNAIAALLRDLLWVIPHKGQCVRCAADFRQVVQWRRRDTVCIARKNCAR